MVGKMLAAALFVMALVTMATTGSICQNYKSVSACQSQVCGTGAGVHCYWNYSTSNCACCQKSCPYPLKLNKITCQCICPPFVTCTGNTYINYLSCECECPYLQCVDGKTYDESQCKCTCPEKSYWDSDTMHCVAQCEDMVATYCRQVRSKRNKHTSCRLDNGVCRSPTCASFYRDPLLCSMSTCVDTEESCKWVYYPYYPYSYYCSC